MADSSPFQDGGELGHMASPGRMLQAKCKSPDPLASCHEDSSDKGPALPEDLQERGSMPSKGLSKQGPMPSKDLSEQWEQALSEDTPKHGLILPLQTPVTNVIPSILPPLRPDHLISLDVSSTRPSDVASCDSENKSVVNKDAQINTLVSLQEALEEVSEPLELEPSLTSVSPVKIGICEFNKKNPFALPETSEMVPGRSSSLTEKSIDIAEAMTENLADSVAIPVMKVGTVDTASPEKSNEIADSSEFTIFAAAISAGEKCASVVSALTEKSPDRTETYEELLSDISLPSEKTLVDDMGQLQKCSVVDVMSPQPCLTLDTVEEPHLLKLCSPFEGELVSPLDSREKPASLPIASFDHPSPLPSVSTDVICPLPSTKNSSSSVITVDTKLPYSSSQSSETDTSTPLMPSQKEKDELTQVGSESSGGQDVQEGFNTGSKKQEYMCGTQEGCELNLQADISLDEKLESGEISCVNRILDDSSVVNSDHEMQVDEPGECWNDVESSREESAMDTLPLIVNTHTLCQDDDEHSTVISNNAVSSHLMSSSVLSSPQSSVSNVCTMPLLETEPLQPVTIGSSLQPLEEVQEASVLDDPSFVADLALIDSSADEADSIGGLVINSVIGAADGVVDFHPDEEMETDRELTDISASAPQIVEDTCDNDSNDDNGPSAKRMRFENGVSDLDKVQGTKKVIIRVTPVKNGHGLWDSHKLQEVLLAKGTILLRLHASTDAIEMFETDKDEKEVDFTGIMTDSKDEEHDHILGLANLEPDADVYDPLAIVSAHSADHASPPHYGRPFPHNRGRSTALQPAMSRPGFRHLQSPPHPHYYMKHEVLGLPPPLEFEEPQIGTTDWSGMDTPIVASPESQDPPDPHMAETTSSPSPKPVLVRKRVKKPDRVIRLKKVCEQCGKAFNKSSKYLQHLRTHRPLLQCGKCSFKTKDTKRFRIHEISHKKANPDVRCNICSELFATEVTQRIHKKKIHNIHGCKHCYVDYDSEAKLINHLKEHHGHIKEKKGYVRRSEDEYVKPINIFVDPPPTNEKRQFVCRLCNKETRNKYQLKIHVAQHLGVSSSKISDDFLLTQDVDNLIKEGLSSSSISSQDIKLENLVPICSMEVASLKRELDASSAGNGIHSLSSVSKTDMSSSLISYSSKNPHLDSLPGASLIPTIKQEPIEESSNEQESDVDQDESSYSGGSAVFRCGLCALDFYAPTDLYQHAIKVHQIQNISQTQPSRQLNVSKRVKPSIPCDLCNVSCKSAKALRVHHRVKHRKIFTCPACHVSHKSIIRLLRHQRQIHKDKIRCRFQCSALFDTRKESIIHCREVHNKEVKKVVCPYCEVEYQYEGNLINHLEKCKKCPPERRPAHVCGNCNEILPNIKEYNEHIKHCVLQKKKTDTVTKFKNKIINKGGIEYVELSDDDDDDDGKSELSHKLKKGVEIEEERSDEVKGPQKCKYCPDKFTKEESAINHILAVHKNLITRMITEPQMCEVCGMIFKNQLCLCKHISKHYSDLSMWDVLVPPDILDVVKVKSYCWVCKSTLRGKISHHANMRNENIDKLLATEGLELQETERFHCPKCDDFFPIRSEFWEHVKVHLLELPKWSRQLSGPSSSDSCPNKITSTYECNECSLKFTNNSEFYRHLAVHFLEPYTDEIDSNNIDKDGSECEQIGSENDVGDDEAEDDDFDLEGFMNPDAKYN